MITDQPTLRTWSDITGKHKVQAEFVELKENTVVLKNLDGKTINLPLNKLSKADQEVVANLTRPAGSPKGADHQPKALGSDDTQATAGGSGDWSSAQQIVPQVIGGDWSLQIDNAAPAKIKPRAVALRPKKQDEFFEKGVGLLIAASPKPLAILTLGNQPPGQAPGRTTLEWCDLSGPAKTPASTPFKHETLPLDVSDDGTLLVARANGFHLGQKDRLFLWSIEGRKAIPRSSFVPYPDDQHADHDIVWASLLGSDRLLTASWSGKVACWDLNSQTVIYWLPAARMTRPALSPGGKQLAVITDAGIVILDPGTGDTLAALPGQFGMGSIIAYRPDSAQLALLNSRRLLVWDLATGKEHRDISLIVETPSQRIDWTDKNYVLVDGQWLVDLDRRIVLWQYEGHSPELSATVGDAYLYFAEQGNMRGLMPLALPHAEAKKVAAGLDPDRLLAVKPGVKVSIEVNSPIAADQQQKVIDALSQRLQSQGLEVEPNQPIKLVASTSTGKSQEIAYRGFGFRENKITVTEQIATISLMVNGKTAWEARTVATAPPVVFIEKDKTLEQAIAEYQKPPLKYFETVHVPNYVPKPRDQKAYGLTKLTMQGPMPGVVK
jgi:hypothetical protein